MQFSHIIDRENQPLTYSKNTNKKKLILIL